MRTAEEQEEQLDFEQAIQASLTSHRIQQNNNLVTANQAKKQIHSKTSASSTSNAPQ